MKITITKNSAGRTIEHRDYGDGAGAAERSLSARDLEQLWSVVKKENLGTDDRARLARSIQGDGASIMQKLGQDRLKEDQLQVRDGDLSVRRNPDPKTRARNEARRTDPMVIIRVARSEVYDLRGLASDAFDPAASRRLVDRARRAVDLAEGPAAVIKRLQKITSTDCCSAATDFGIRTVWLAGSWLPAVIVTATSSPGSLPWVFDRALLRCRLVLKSP